MRWVIFTGLAGVALGVAFFACSSSADDASDASDASPGDAPADTTDVADAGPSLPYPLNQVCPPFENDGSFDECGVCRHEKCCNTRAAADTDAGNAIANCAGDALQANDAGALQGCFDEYPAATQPFLDELTCLEYRCTGECSDPHLELDACDTCLLESCASDFVAVDVNADCLLESTCYGACGQTADCATSCGDQYPAAMQLLTSLATCRSKYCAAQCN